MLKIALKEMKLNAAVLNEAHGGRLLIKPIRKKRIQFLGLVMSF